MPTPLVVVGSRNTSRWPDVAGSTWVRLQYVLGLRSMGIDVCWIERMAPVDPRVHPHSLSYLTERFARTAAHFGIADCYCIDYNDGEHFFGMSESSLNTVATSADLLINLSGYLPARSALSRIPRRAYIDVDPGFTQIWARQLDLGIDRHNFHFTVGQNVGTDRFKIPSAVRWKPIFPPVALEQWPARIDPTCTRISTVGDWRGSQYAIHEGELYGGKRVEYIRNLTLPKQTSSSFELALCIGSEDWEDIGLLVNVGWRLLDPYLYAGDPLSYREFIQQSRAEFSVAKSGYIKSNSGWISDRTACYLASGKPVLVQSTGADWCIPSGKGLVTFTSPEDAIVALRQIESNYIDHCHAARQLAEQHFDARKVLGSMLCHVGL